MREEITMSKTDDNELAKAVDAARAKYGPNMTREQIQAVALDYAMKSAIGLTFDEMAAKSAEKNEDPLMQSIREICSPLAVSKLPKR